MTHSMTIGQLSPTDYAELLNSIKERIKVFQLAAQDIHKRNYLYLKDEYRKRHPKEVLLRCVKSFLQEMGGTFTFVGSQYRLEIDDEAYFIDILLYHRRLKCLVAIDLKIGKFLPEYVGKMQFYLAALDDTVADARREPIDWDYPL